MKTAKDPPSLSPSQRGLEVTEYDGKGLAVVRNGGRKSVRWTPISIRLDRLNIIIHPKKRPEPPTFLAAIPRGTRLFVLITIPVKPENLVATSLTQPEMSDRPAFAS
jgi:hypothetical protein